MIDRPVGGRESIYTRESYAPLTIFELFIILFSRIKGNIEVINAMNVYAIWQLILNLPLYKLY